MTKEAIVLAGGLGTRLRPVVKDVPKPMAKVAGRPFLDYILYNLAKYKVERIVLAVGHKHEIIQDYYEQEQNSFGMQITYSVEKELLGTGGAIFEAAKLIVSDTFFVLNGDTFFDADLFELGTFAIKKEADIAIALKNVPFSTRYGKVICNSADQIISFKEKDSIFSDELIINGGVYFMKKNTLDTFSLPSKFSFEVDFLQKNIEQLKAFGKEFSGTFIDLGMPEDYHTAQELLKNVISTNL